MDKQTSDTIKIKINGKDRPMSQGEKTGEVIPFSSWEEKLDAEKEIASAKQTVEEEDEFPWLLPDEDDTVFKDDPKVVTTTKKTKLFSNQSVTPYQYSNKKTRNKNIVAFPLKKFMTIFLLAIGLGVMFGFIALNFLSNEDMPTAGTTSESTNEEQATGDTSDQAKGDTEEKAGGEAGSATTSANLQLYAVQGGIFSSKEAANIVADNIKEKGFASIVMETDGSYTVFAGLGMDKAETSALSEVYKQQNFDDIEFWGGKQLSLTISTISAADQWASTIQELSSLASAASNGESVNQEAVSKIESTINGIKTTDETEKSLVEKLLQAADSVKNNQGWDAQQHILEVTNQITS
ncbi:SPOR domain-containing protein [Metabacillus bambusae]|uniref:SPOR domain-containing protein n=1 Tax=Metabacillus bambusae TaxID=2795218 RepID=A0ABS3NA18_9BACI|nr:SPOR domain-containing protein [Metabacillus bambusae]MBO1514763.1 SPOR domain-containing protein [Metabacillus bambusae]